MTEEKLRILLVDDEPAFYAPVSFWLKTKGYHVDIADDGATALRLITEKSPDIVLLDVIMPVMDGLETLKRLRAANKTIPVIMITAYASKEVFDEAQKLNVSGFFSKTANVEELEVAIGVALKTYKKIWKEDNLKESD